MKKYIWWLAAVALALGLVAQYAIYRAEQPAITAHASWVSQPESFAELADASKAIVEAEVIAVDPGKPITVPAKGEPSGQDTIPTERITVRVLSSEKGEARVGENLVVFRTGGRVEIPAGPDRGDNPLDAKRGTERLDAPPGEKPKADPNLPVPGRNTKPDPDAPAAVSVKILLLPEDPEYQVGSHIFLALTDGPDGTLRPVAPSGRYEVQGDGSVRGVVNDNLASNLSGRSLEDLKSAARGETVIADDGANRRVTTPGGETVGMPTTGHANDTFDWIMFFGIGMLLMFAGLGTLAISGIRSAFANRHRD